MSEGALRKGLLRRLTTAVTCALIGAGVAAGTAGAQTPRIYCDMVLAAHAQCGSEYGYGTISANGVQVGQFLSACETVWNGGPINGWGCNPGTGGSYYGRTYPNVYGWPMIFNGWTQAQQIHGYAVYM